MTRLSYGSVGISGRNVQFHFHTADKDSTFCRVFRQFSQMTGRTTIHLQDESDRWRWVCPRGHRSWEPTNHHFWCQKCARLDGADGVFHELRNKKTGNLVKRDDLLLETPVGQYESREGSA